jgi:AcrR family transcriptional regulator
MATPKPERALRKDAARNRELLVSAAVAAFQQKGLAASVNDIAAQAGVNVATLYRHFATKDALVAAVADRLLEPLAGARDQALDEDRSGGALSVFLATAVQLQIEHRGLVDALTGGPADPDFRGRLRGPAIALVEPLVDRARRDGELREDFDAADVLIALRMVLVVAYPGLPAGRELDRYVDLVLRGLAPS